jgi:hypothetical protein
MKKHVLVIMAMVLLPVCAFAVDGVVLINQSTVMAAGGFPYVISQPGSYKLSGNLVATTDHQAILFTTNNVALDLNGFTVTCTEQHAVAFFRCVGDSPLSGVSDLNIRNGVVAVSATVDGSSATIVSFDNSKAVIVENLQVKMYSPAVRGFVGLAAGSGSIVRHNIITPNGNFIGGLNVICPGVIEGNVTGGIGTFTFSTPGCVLVNNVGAVSAF